jgi:hypothetical protein
VRNRQSGMTFLGLLVLIVVVGSWVYAAIRITPLYLNYMKIAGTLEKVRDEYDSDPGTTEMLLRNSVMKYFDIEMVNEKVFTFRDVVIRKEGDKYTMTAAYEDTAPFVGNIYFLVDFDKRVEVRAR